MPSKSRRSRALLGEGGTYNPDHDLKPWILSDTYFLDKSPSAEEVAASIPDFMEGWLPFTSDWPITGFRDDSKPNTNFRTQKSPVYSSIDELAPHQIPVNIVTLTDRMDLKFGTKMNPYIGGRNGEEYSAKCSDVSGKQDRYEGGTISYAMFDACHGLLYVEDMTIAVNSFLQKRGQSVEFVLMEFSIHRHDTCWAPEDVGACRNELLNDGDFAKTGMINVFVVDSEEPFYQASIGNSDFDTETPFVRGQTTLGPHTWRGAQFGSHLLVDGGTGRGMQIMTHELMHTFGMEHVAGKPVGATLYFEEQPSGETFEFDKLKHPNCESNCIGLWVCSAENVEAGHCAPEEECCGTKPKVPGQTCEKKLPVPGAYTPTYAEPFGRIIDTWMYLNEIVPLEVPDFAPDGTCEKHSDEYSCWDQSGCYFDQAPALCKDIPNWPDFPAPAPIQLDTDYHGDSENIFHPNNNVFPYSALSEEELEYEVTGGICTRDNTCCRRVCVPDGYSGTDIVVEIWDESMSERIEMIEGAGNMFSAPSFDGAEGERRTFNFKVRTMTKSTEYECHVAEDWTAIPECWDKKFGGKFTFKISNGDYDDECEPEESAECEVEEEEVDDPNDPCREGRTPGCHEALPQEEQDPACWRGTCLQESFMDDDYTVCSDMSTFKWCVTWFCGNGYNHALTEMEDYKIMEGCLCDSDTARCEEMANFKNTGQFTPIERGGPLVKKPRVKGEYCQSTEECAWVKGHKGGSCDYQCVFFEDLYEGDGECHKVDEACEDGNSEDDGEGEEEEDEEEEEEEDDEDEDSLVHLDGTDGDEEEKDEEESHDNESPGKVDVTIRAKMVVEIGEVPESGSDALRVLAGGVKRAVEKVIRAKDGADAVVTILSINGVDVGRKLRVGRRLAAVDVAFEVSIPEQPYDGDETTAVFWHSTLNSAIGNGELDIVDGMEQELQFLVSEGDINFSDKVGILDSVTFQGVTAMSEVVVTDVETHGSSKARCRVGNDSDCEDGFRCEEKSSEVRNRRRKLFGNMYTLYNGECVEEE